MGSEAHLATGRLLRLQAERRATWEVPIGDVVVGGTRPIAVQSMTTTRTTDARATADQIASLARAGCEIVRVTVPSSKDGDALPEIRALLAAEGVRVPLVADIHFTPRLALRVVEHVEKVRINPGNFADKKSLAGASYDDARWERDVVRAFELFAPVADRARELGVAIRIGVNHGSLSDRMVYRYGDSPEGMVESALEFVRFAEDRGHRQLVVSMKASIPQVVVRAYRLLAERLDAAGSPYPLHLGVTEAGGGDEGRMKSAAGMAALLGDGLGDTIRVSLTEAPENEVPVAREIVRLFGREAPAGTREPPASIRERREPLDPVRRPSTAVELSSVVWGGDEVPRVEIVLGAGDGRAIPSVLAARPPVELVDVELGRGGDVAEALRTLSQLPPAGGPARAATLLVSEWVRLSEEEGGAGDLSRLSSLADRLGLVVDDPEDLARVDTTGAHATLLELAIDGPLNEEEVRRLRSFAGHVAGRAAGTMAGLRAGPAADVVGAYRALAALLDSAGSRAPIVLSDRLAPGDDPRLGTAGRLAGLLIDGIGDAIRVRAGDDPAGSVRLAHGVLQAAGRRLEKAEFIACPSCGRTLFELEETTRRIRELTEHLKLKIAVMGCIVNGPGEMADADFGYVGWGEGKVALFVGREMVAKDIAFEDAPERLVFLIKSRGRWTEPEPPQADGEAQ